MNKTNLQNLPQSPGVYIFRNIEKQILYVGKAVNLSKRIKQYFQRDDAVGAKTKLLVSQINSIETIQTASEFDALLLEAKLIYQQQPKYNIIAKDDKSPLYVQLTLDEDLPRIVFIRRPRQATYGETYEEGTVIFGPFQSARMVRWVLSNIRRIIPYCNQKIRTGKPCFYTHIGLCHPCASVIEKMSEGEEKKKLIHQYRQNIFRLRDVLSGKGLELRYDLEKKMKLLAKLQQFEEAANMRNQIQGLLSLYKKRIDPLLYLQNTKQLELGANEETATLHNILVDYYPHLQELERIECVDISNTQGTYATGSLVVFTNGLSNKSEYRRFRIKREAAPNDFAMIFEVITRRLHHAEWKFPNLLIIDGGKGQVQSAFEAMKKSIDVNSMIPIIGLAKRREEIILFESEKLKKLVLPYNSSAIHLLERIRDEAHRFALAYHRLLRGKGLKT